MGVGKAQSWRHMSDDLLGVLGLHGHILGVGLEGWLI